MKRTNEHKDSQIGCGYCAHEKQCPIRDPKVNKARAGCEKWLHHEDAEKVKR